MFNTRVITFCCPLGCAPCTEREPSPKAATDAGAASASGMVSVPSSWRAASWLSRNLWISSTAQKRQGGEQGGGELIIMFLDTKIHQTSTPMESCRTHTRVAEREQGLHTESRPKGTLLCYYRLLFYNSRGPRTVFDEVAVVSAITVII